MERPTAFERAVLSLSRLIPITVPNSMSCPDRYTARIAERADDLHRTFYGKWANFSNAIVAELGGTGVAAAHYLKLGPKEMYVVNLSFTDELRRSIESESSIVEFVQSTAAGVPLRDDGCDIIISENTFEHITSYSQMMADCNRILRPGGVLMARFSPLYYSPFGAHLYEIIKLPWVSLLFREQRLSRMVAYELERRGFGSYYDYMWEQFRSLNRLRPGDFLAPFHRPEWEIVHTRSFPLAWSLKSPEPVRTLLTHGIELVARKPASHEAA